MIAGSWAKRTVAAEAIYYGWPFLFLPNIRYFADIAERGRWSRTLMG